MAGGQSAVVGVAMDCGLTVRAAWRRRSWVRSVAMMREVCYVCECECGCWAVGQMMRACDYGVCFWYFCCWADFGDRGGLDAWR